MRVQVAHAVKVGESQDAAALDLLGRLSRLASSNFASSVLRVVRLTNPPQCVCRCWVGHSCHDLLSTSTAQILAFAVQKVFLPSLSFRFIMAELDGRTASHKFVIVFGEERVIAKRRRGREKERQREGEPLSLNEHQHKST